MNSKVKVTLIILAAAAVIFGIVRYVTLFGELKETRGRLKENQIHLAQVIKEKEDLQDELDVTQGQLATVKENLEKTQNELNIVNQKLSTEQEDNGKLRQEKQDLEQKVSSLTQERDTLEARLHSLNELKAAIRQVKIEIHEQKVQEFLARIKHQQELDAQKLQKGNKGFIVKDGKSLFTPKVDIEVLPSN